MSNQQCCNSCLNVLILIIVAIGGSNSLAHAAAPLAICPENGHYFTWHGKPTVLVTSGEHYGAVMNLDFDYVRYLDTLAADGLNLTRTFSGVYREMPGSFGITENTLAAPLPGRYLAPWARSDKPGYTVGGNKFDLARWDDGYFARLKKFMAAANQRGVVVEFNLFCPFYDNSLWRASPMNALNNVNGIGDCKSTEPMTLKHPKLLEVQLALVRKFVVELNEFSNLYFEVCNEPYFAGVAKDWQWRIAETISDAERRLPNKHLISMNIANGRQKVEKPCPQVSIFNFHYAVPPDTVAMNYGLNKVIGENETGFRGPQDVLYRTEAWDFLLAGGGLYNNLDYSFVGSHPDGSLRGFHSPGGGSPQLRKQLGVLKRFMDGLDLPKLKPDTALVRSVSEHLTHYALSDAGRDYAIYLHVPLPEKPDKIERFAGKKLKAGIMLQLPGGHYSGKWIDAKTGEILGQAGFDNGSGRYGIQSPEFVDDIVLRITRK